MPAIITHHIFGEDAAALLPEGLLEGQEELLAFLLGNQGTDPFFARFSTTPPVARTCHAFANQLHEEKMAAVFGSLRASVSRLRPEDASCGRAFALGMAAHYVLDSLAHPLVYAQQEGFVAAEPSLSDARSEVHAIIESDIDVWMLWEKRQASILDMPCTSCLARTDRIEHVAGALLSQVARDVFGLDVSATQYAAAVRDYQLMYQLIDPPASASPRILARLETLARPHSRLLAQSHRVVCESECAFANLDHKPWRNPYTGEASTASFADLFHDALLAWPEFARRFAQGDSQRLDDMIAGVNYNGRPIAS